VVKKLFYFILATSLCANVALSLAEIAPEQVSDMSGFSQHASKMEWEAVNDYFLTPQERAAAERSKSHFHWPSFKREATVQQPKTQYALGQSPGKLKTFLWQLKRSGNPDSYWN
jgi:hypothetical protein